jgi:hypothetical protein
MHERQVECRTQEATASHGLIMTVSGLSYRIWDRHMMVMMNPLTRKFDTKNPEGQPQSTHRMKIADFWLTSHHDGKISPGWWGGGGARPPHFSLL